MSAVTLDAATALCLLDPARFQLILLPTEQCNLRCTYCYEDFTVGRMPPEIVDAVKALVRRRTRTPVHLALSWFGGEPLLVPDIILDVSSAARADALAGGGTFSGHVTTNGYRLDLRLFRRLVDADVNQFQITLDGSGEIHDRTRRRRDGGPTFERIWRNLLAIRDETLADILLDFHVALRIHYDGSTVRDLENLVGDLEHEFAHVPQFSVHFHEIERLGGPRDNETVVPDADDHELVRTHAARLRNVGLVSSVMSDHGPYVCYAARANSLLVRADGRVGKCTVALSDPRNDVGSIRPDGTLELDDGRLQPWLRGAYSADPTELACPLNGLPPAPSSRAATALLPLEVVTR